MKDEDVRIGMKVVPHDKTATGWGELSDSREWKAAQEKGQPFLFVSSQETNAFGGKLVWVLYATHGGGGDLFNASDFEPYKPRRVQEIQAEIERLEDEINRLLMPPDIATKDAEISALKNDIAAPQETIKTQLHNLVEVINERDYYKNACHKWSEMYDKDIAAKDAEIAELGRRIRDLLKKQDASEKPELLPVGSEVMVDYDKDIYAATIIKVDEGDPLVPYRVRFDDGQERWVRRRRVTSIPADLLPVGTRVMLTGTIIGVYNKADTTGNFPYNVYLDGDQDRWFPKTAVKPLNHD